MKICLMITGLGMGGAEQQTCRLADEFARLGHSVHLFVLNDFNHQVVPNDPAVVVHYLGLKKKVTSFVSVYARLRKVVGEIQPDVIHAHMFHANVFARLLRLSTPMKRLICTAHSTNEGNNWRMLAYRVSNFLSDVNTNVSQEAVDAFVARGAMKTGQMFAVGNGIDVDRFCKNDEVGKNLRQNWAWENGEYVFLAVGRLTLAKDYPNLLKAFAQVWRQRPEVRLAIVGAGELEAELKNLCENMGIQSVVNFLGMRRDVADVMNVADTYVLSSSFEGLPLVIGEAMATEKVVVATDCGGVKEVLGGNGFLVAPENSELLARAMLQSMVLSDEAKKQMGQNARQHIIQNYSLSSIAQKWLSIYQS